MKMTPDLLPDEYRTRVVRALCRLGPNDLWDEKAGGPQEDCPPDDTAAALWSVALALWEPDLLGRRPGDLASMAAGDVREVGHLLIAVADGTLDDWLRRHER